MKSHFKIHESFKNKMVIDIYTAISKFMCLH